MTIKKIYICYNCASNFLDDTESNIFVYISNGSVANFYCIKNRDSVHCGFSNIFRCLFRKIYTYCTSGAALLFKFVDVQLKLVSESLQNKYILHSSSCD